MIEAEDQPQDEPEQWTDEAEDEHALTAFNLAIAMQGNVRSRSMRAFPAGEMDKILAKLP